MLCPIIFWVGFAVLFCLGWFVFPRRLFWQTIEAPDRALAYLALFIGFALLFQQATGYNHGLVYMVSYFPSPSIRTIIDNAPPQSSHVIGAWRTVMIAAYWIFLAGGLLALLALVKDTMRDYKERKARKDDTLHEDIQSLHDDVQTTHDDVQATHDDIQALIKQMAEIGKNIQSLIQRLDRDNDNEL